MPRQKRKCSSNLYWNRVGGHRHKGHFRNSTGPQLLSIHINDLAKKTNYHIFMFVNAKLDGSFSKDKDLKGDMDKLSEWGKNMVDGIYMAEPHGSTEPRGPDGGRCGDR